MQANECHLTDFCSDVFRACYNLSRYGISFMPTRSAKPVRPGLFFCAPVLEHPLQHSFLGHFCRLAVSLPFTRRRSQSLWLD
jgi:hypothetical protein